MSIFNTFKKITGKTITLVVAVAFLAVSNVYASKSYLAPESEGSKNGFSYLTRALQKVITLNGPKDDSDTSRFNSVVKKLSDSLGYYWPYYMATVIGCAGIIKMVPLPAENTNSISENIVSDFGGTAVLVSASILAVALLYIAQKTLNKGAGRRFSMAMTMGTDDDEEDAYIRYIRRIAALPDGKGFRNSYIKLRENNMRKIAYFDRDRTSKEVKYKLKDLYQIGDMYLMRRNKTTDEMVNAVNEVARMINAEPNGDLVNGIIVIEEGKVVPIQIDRFDNVLIVIYPLLQKLALMEVILIPHEVYHSVGSPKEEKEEVLVTALSFVRAVNIYRKGKKDDVAKSLFENTMSELYDFERKDIEKGEKTMYSTLKEIVEETESEENRMGRMLSSEEVLDISIKKTVEYFRPKIERFHAKDNYIDKLKKMKNEDYEKIVKQYWDKKREKMLRGRSLYSVLLPVVFLDYSSFLSNSIYFQTGIRWAVLGLLLSDRWMIYQLSSVIERIKQHRQIHPAPGYRSIEYFNGIIDGEHAVALDA